MAAQETRKVVIDLEVKGAKAGAGFKAVADQAKQAAKAAGEVKRALGSDSGGYTLSAADEAAMQSRRQADAASLAAADKNSKKIRDKFFAGLERKQAAREGANGKAGAAKAAKAEEAAVKSNRFVESAVFVGATLFAAKEVGEKVAATFNQLNEAVRMLGDETIRTEQKVVAMAGAVPLLGPALEALGQFFLEMEGETAFKKGVAQMGAFADRRREEAAARRQGAVQARDIDRQRLGFGDNAAAAAWAAQQFQDPEFRKQFATPEGAEAAMRKLRADQAGMVAERDASRLTGDRAAADATVAEAQARLDMLEQTARDARARATATEKQKGDDWGRNLPYGLSFGFTLLDQGSDPWTGKSKQAHESQANAEKAVVAQRDRLVAALDQQKAATEKLGEAEKRRSDAVREKTQAEIDLFKKRADILQGGKESIADMSQSERQGALMAFERMQTAGWENLSEEERALVGRTGLAGNQIRDAKMKSIANDPLAQQIIAQTGFGDVEAKLREGGAIPGTNQTSPELAFQNQLVLNEAALAKAIKEELGPLISDIRVIAVKMVEENIALKQSEQRAATLNSQLAGGG